MVQHDRRCWLASADCAHVVWSAVLSYPQSGLVSRRQEWPLAGAAVPSRKRARLRAGGTVRIQYHAGIFIYYLDTNLSPEGEAEPGDLWSYAVYTRSHGPCRMRRATGPGPEHRTATG